MREGDRRLEALLKEYELHTLEIHGHIQSVTHIVGVGVSGVGAAAGFALASEAHLLGAAVPYLLGGVLFFAFQEVAAMMLLSGHKEWLGEQINSFMGGLRPLVWEEVAAKIWGRGIVPQITFGAFLGFFFMAVSAYSLFITWHEWGWRWAIISGSIIAVILGALVASAASWKTLRANARREAERLATQRPSNKL